jgi:hypothetical protein
LVKERARSDKELPHPLDGIDPKGKFGEYGCLVTRTGSYLKDTIIWGHLKGLGHLGDNIRLRNSLTLTNGKGEVSIGLILQGLAYKKMPGNLAHSLKDPVIMDTTGFDLGIHHLFP